MLDAGTTDAGSDGTATGTDGSDASGATCDQTLSAGADVASAISSAAAGTTICLGAGSYARVDLSNIAKTSDVAVQAVPGVTASLSFVTISNSSHVKFQNLTIGGCEIAGGSTKNITLSRNAFLATCHIDTLDMVNANILVDGNTFDAINANGGYEGRLQISQYPSQAQVAGVTVTNNHFGKFGCSDGIQIGSYGIVVGPGNVFEDSAQGNCVEHVDSIQLYGQSHTTIKGNYFVRVNVCIGAYDGGDTEVVTNNVFVASGGTNNCVLDFGSMSNLEFSHNTIIGANPRLGGINEPRGVTGAILNNILMGGSFNTSDGDGCACTFDHNLFDLSTAARGTNAVIGIPTFVGGSNPAAWVGYQLTAGSPGYKAASDGRDIGINL